MTVYIALHKKTRRGLAFEADGDIDDRLRQEIGEFGELYRREGYNAFAILSGCGTVDETIAAYGLDRPGLGFHHEDEVYDVAPTHIVSTNPDTGDEVEYESVEAALEALGKTSAAAITRALNKGSKAYGLKWERRVED
jgi:hypothetical protein